MRITRELKPSQKDKSGKAPIRLVIRWRGTRIYYPVGLHYYPEKWDTAKGCPRDRSADAADITRMLNDAEQFVHDIYKELYNPASFPDEDEFRRRLFQEREVVKKDYSFTQLFKTFVEEKSQVLSSHTIRHYRVALDHLFAAGVPDDVRAFNETTANKLYQHLVKTDHNNSTTAKIIQKANLLHEYAHQKNLVDKPYKKEQTAKGVSSDRTYLTLEELKSFKAVPLPPELEESRQMFIFACLTGLRHSDLSTLTTSNIIRSEGQWVVKKQQVKTKQQVVIPLVPYAKNLIENRPQGKALFSQLSQQKYSKHLKQIAKLAGLTSQVEVISYTGTKENKETKPKWQTISSHTARHTFAVLSLIQGMRIEVLQKVLGHKNIGSTLVYGKIAESMKTDEMLKAWDSFFQ